MSTRWPTCSPAPATRPAIFAAERTRPGYFEVRGEVPPPPPYSPLAHNCSGKHSGMLAYCVQCGLPRDSYLDDQHPLQQAIRRAVARFTATPESELVAGIDGCSAPNYAVALARLAQAFARLAADARRRRVRQCAARARRRDDCAPGDGLGRAPLRSRVEPGRARRLGLQDRRGGRPGDRAPRRRRGDRDQDRRRQPPRAAAGHRVGAGPAGAAGRRTARVRSRTGSSRPCATIAVS